MQNQPENDVKEITATLPNGQVFVVRISDTGRIYQKGTTIYWDADKLEAGLAKLRAAGAEIVERAL